MPNPIRSRSVWLATVAAIGAAVFAAGAAAQTAPNIPLPVRFTALAVNMARGGSATIEMRVDNWTTDAERDRLLNVLMDQGPDKLLDALQKAPKVGYIRRSTSLGYDLRYARAVPEDDGGTKVVLATDRRMAFWEVANQTRSVDYPFTVVELHLNKDGEGEGKLSLATRITADKENKLIVLENYATQPVLLKSVKMERVKP
jgi:hypothetical protein